MYEPLHTDPWCWAFVALLGLHGATSLFSGHAWSRSGWFVGAMLVLATVGRAMLPLPFVVQPRLAPAVWHAIVGWGLFASGLVIGASGLEIRWWRTPAADTKLRTTGAYGWVRHPIYLCEVVWPLGLSLALGSVVGLALTPLWWFVFLVHALAEEASLRRELGDVYRHYEARVRGRMLPGLPF